MEPDREPQAGGYEEPASQLAPADWATMDEIRRKSFSTVPEGYDPDEVRTYLNGLAEFFTHLAQIKAGPVVASDVPAQQSPDSASELATRMAEVLREAEEHAARIREEAEGEAKLMLAGALEQAEQDAALMAAATREKTEQLMEEAREKADRTRGQALLLLRDAEQKAAQAAALRDAVVAELRAAWERISTVTGQVADSGVAPAHETATDVPIAIDVSADVEPEPAVPPVEAPVLEMPPLAIDGPSENEAVAR